MTWGRNFHFEGHIKAKTVCLNVIDSRSFSLGSNIRGDHRYILRSYSTRVTYLLPSFYSKFKKVGDDGLIEKIGDKILVTFSYGNFLYENYFIKTIKENLDHNASYYVLIKIRHNVDLYKMAGKQFTFNNDSNIISHLSKLYETIRSRLQLLMEEYKITEKEMVHVQIILKPFSKSILTDFQFSDNFDFLNEKPVSLKKDVLYFPITSESEFLGNQLKITSFKGLNITLNNNYKIKAEDNKMMDLLLDKNTSFYLRDVVNPPFILSILNKLDNSIKFAFDLKGNYYGKVYDTKKDDNITIREARNTSLTIKNKSLIKSVTNLKLIPIKTTKPNPQILEDQKLGVFDLEVYKNISLDKECVYAAGIYSYPDFKPTLFYINESLDSDQLLLELINGLFKDK